MTFVKNLNLSSFNINSFKTDKIVRNRDKYHGPRFYRKDRIYCDYIERDSAKYVHLANNKYKKDLTRYGVESNPSRIVAMSFCEPRSW